MSSTETGQTLSMEQRRTLLATARASIQNGLDMGVQLKVDLASADKSLQQVRACFVTLNKDKQLRGCIGHLEAMQPLIQDVAENAFAAAFRDTRFSPLQREEYPELEVHISVLGKPSPMEFASEQDLIDQLQPNVDGLILEDGRNRGTFLPSVWESLPQPTAFLRHLKVKAGLAPNYWSDRIRIYRYHTESFGD